MWAYESVFYQIYPLGFCGAPYENDNRTVNRIQKVKEWIPHIKGMNCNAIYFSPVFESDTHGYNTRDYQKIDARLRTNEDFREICTLLHKEEIKIVLDGVFNHAGRGFFAFQDVIQNGKDSKYSDWFYLNFSGQSPYGDSFSYEGWEGNFDLVKLNLNNEAVVRYLLESVKSWIDYFDIDGIRLDVAYCLEPSFMEKLRSSCDQWKNDFFLVGEMIHGDYRRLISDRMLHSTTNYECYKGLYSSFNSMNLFEINHSLMRQFADQPEGIYHGMHLLSFADNHDVSRIASILTNERHLEPLYGILFGMPGIPCIYYGSEWGAKGDKKDGDAALRVSFDQPVENSLYNRIKRLAYIRRNSKALTEGAYRSVFLTNKQCIIERKYEQETIWIAVNADGESYCVHPQQPFNEAIDLLTDQKVDGKEGILLPEYGLMILQL